MVERFDLWYEARANRTEEVEIPDRKGQKPTMHVPVFHSISEVLGYGEAAAGNGSHPEALSAGEADLLRKLETGELSPEEMARFGL